MPFGDHCQYKKFSDCTKAHSDKDDPSAYCATIQDKTEKHCARAARIETRRKALRVAAVRQAVGDTYQWDPNAKQYLKDGVAVSLATLLAIRDQLTDAQFNDADDLADQLAEDGDLEAWQADMRALVEETHTASYMLGRGGVNVMGVAEKAVLATLIASQFTYLRDFAADVLAGLVSVAQARARAEQYMASATFAFARGHSAAYGDDLDLPAYPGDGGTACLMSCRCAWDIEEHENEWRCYWLDTSDDNECSDCDERASLYNPYVQKRETQSQAA